MDRYATYCDINDFPGPSPAADAAGWTKDAALLMAQYDMATKAPQADESTVHVNAAMGATTAEIVGRSDGGDHDALAAASAACSATSAADLVESHGWSFSVHMNIKKPQEEAPQCIGQEYFERILDSLPPIPYQHKILLLSVWFDTKWSELNDKTSLLVKGIIVSNIDVRCAPFRDWLQHENLDLDMQWIAITPKHQIVEEFLTCSGHAQEFLASRTAGGADHLQFMRVDYIGKSKFHYSPSKNPAASADGSTTARLSNVSCPGKSLPQSAPAMDSALTVAAVGPILMNHRTAVAAGSTEMAAARKQAQCSEIEVGSGSTKLAEMQSLPDLLGQLPATSVESCSDGSTKAAVLVITGPESPMSATLPAAGKAGSAVKEAVTFDDPAVSRQLADVSAIPVRVDLSPARLTKAAAVGIAGLGSTEGVALPAAGAAGSTKDAGLPSGGAEGATETVVDNDVPDCQVKKPTT